MLAIHVQHTYSAFRHVMRMPVWGNAWADGWVGGWMREWASE